MRNVRFKLVKLSGNGIELLDQSFIHGALGLAPFGRVRAWHRAYSAILNPCLQFGRFQARNFSKTPRRGAFGVLDLAKLGTMDVNPRNRSGNRSPLGLQLGKVIDGPQHVLRQSPFLPQILACLILPQPFSCNLHLAPSS